MTEKAGTKLENFKKVFEENRIIKYLKKNFFSSDPLLEDDERIRATRLINLYTLISLISGALLIIIIQPFGVPDEQAHFLNVLKISHFNFLPDTLNGQAGTYITPDEINFTFYFARSVDPLMNWGLLSDFDLVDQSSMVFFASNHMTLNPFAYAVAGIPLGIIRFIFPKIEVYSTFLIARILNLTFSIIVTRYALKITPVFKNTMFILALMPITLQQCASTSYDAILIPASFLFFAISMRIIMSNDDYTVTKWDIFTVCFCCAFLFATKIAYGVLIILLLAISFKKFGNLKRYLICIGLVCLMGILFYLIPTLLISNALSAIGPSASDILISQQTDYVMANIGILPRVVIDTTKTFMKSWISQFLGGYLGWLIIKIPEIFMIIFFIILMLTAINDACKIKSINIKTRLLSLAPVVIVYLGLIIGMYIRWNPVIGQTNTFIAHGVQGRYFIPIFLFAILPFANPLMTSFKYNKKLTDVCEKASIIAVILLAIISIFANIAYYWL